MKRYDRSSVSELAEHFVITTKFRGRVLRGDVAIKCEKTIREICRNIDVKILEIAVELDHVHLLLQHSPKLSISEIMEKIKSNSSRLLRQKFPHLKKWCKKALWSRGFYVGSMGRGEWTVRGYIRKQGKNHASSGMEGSVGRLPNAVVQPDDTL